MAVTSVPQAMPPQHLWDPKTKRAHLTYDFSSCLFPEFKIIHFQNRVIKRYTVVLLFLCFLKFLLKLCCS